MTSCDRPQTAKLLAGLFDGALSSPITTPCIINRTWLKNE
jgi:hypothetical protein